VVGLNPTFFMFFAGLFAEEFQKGSTWRLPTPFPVSIRLIVCHTQHQVGVYCW